MEKLKYTKTFYTLLIVLSFAIFMGCSKAQGLKGLVKVKGTITLDGSPLEGASIVFVPTTMSDEVRSASGTSDASGNFEMTTLNKGDGAMPGDYRITVVKREAAGNAPTAEEMQEAALRGVSLNIQYESVIPARYGVSSSSGLSTTVVAGQKDPVKIELTSQ